MRRDSTSHRPHRFEESSQIYSFGEPQALVTGSTIDSEQGYFEDHDREKEEEEEKEERAEKAEKEEKEGKNQLTRTETRESILSRVESRAYSSVVTNQGIDNTQHVGEEFRDIDADLVMWNGADDPENPRNWPENRKWAIVAVVSMYAMVSPLSSSILATAVPQVSQEFGIKSLAIQNLTVSIFILAWAICPLVVTPLSELWGRQIIMNVSITLMTVFNLACGLSQNTTQLLVFRFLAGCAGAPPLSVGAGSLADLFNDAERNGPLALYALGPTLGPVISPVMTGWICQYLNWRWVFWVLVIINGLVAVLGLLLYRETYGPVLLRKRAHQLRKQTGNHNLHTIFEIMDEPLLVKIRHAISRPITILATHPIVLGLGLYMAVIYGFMYLMLVNFTSLWIQYYHYSVGVSGTMYIGLGLGFMAGMAVWVPLIQRRYLALVKRNNGVSKPEFRLALLPYITVFAVVGLLWYGWTAQHRLFWLLPCVGTAIFGFALVAIFQCLQNYLIDMNPRYSASVVGAAAVFRSCFGFAFPLFGTYMYASLGYGWANTLSALLCLVLGVPFPIFVYKYGERVRNWVDQRQAV